MSLIAGEVCFLSFSCWLPFDVVNVDCFCSLVRIFISGCTIGR